MPLSTWLKQQNLQATPSYWMTDVCSKQHKTDRNIVRGACRTRSKSEQRIPQASISFKERDALDIRSLFLLFLTSKGNMGMRTRQFTSKRTVCIIQAQAVVLPIPCSGWVRRSCNIRSSETLKNMQDRGHLSSIVDPVSITKSLWDVKVFSTAWTYLCHPPELLNIIGHHMLS